MKIRTALISVFHKEGLDPILRMLNEHGVRIISTGGTKSYIESQGLSVTAVEELTSFPSILDGRVKTLHPAVFGGVLAKRNEDHLAQLDKYKIPAIDLVIVDLYPFEETVRNSDDDDQIIEKIDIGGISLIRAAAKNYAHTLVVSSRDQYNVVAKTLEDQSGETTLEQRKVFAKEAFLRSTRQDIRVIEYFNRFFNEDDKFRKAFDKRKELRYGENPHQHASFFGNLDQVFEQLHGKALSYNNLIDVDSAIQLIAEFQGEDPTFGVIKHTNCCGLATRSEPVEAWKAALAGDPISAFGGIFVTNHPIDSDTARDMDKLFFEVVIAPDFSREALEILQKKKKRVILRLKTVNFEGKLFRSILNGVIVQDRDLLKEKESDLTVVTKIAPTSAQTSDLLFANISAKHLKSNTISIIKNKQLLGMGCGQTSRVDALKQAITKAKAFGFDLEGSVMASDAFFPFPDCVEIAHEHGIKAVIQPGGSIRDGESIAFCDENGMSMATTGNRHFKH